jgi:hypothetical protein
LIFAFDVGLFSSLLLWTQKNAAVLAASRGGEFENAERWWRLRRFRMHWQKGCPPEIRAAPTKIKGAAQSVFAAAISSRVFRNDMGIPSAIKNPSGRNLTRVSSQKTVYRRNTSGLSCWFFPARVA